MEAAELMRAELLSKMLDASGEWVIAIDRATGVLLECTQSVCRQTCRDREELVGQVNEEACPVAGFGIAAAGAPVLQVDERFDAFRDDLVTALALDVGDKTDATGVAFIGRIEKRA